MAPAPISLHKCKLNIKSVFVTEGRMPLRFCSIRRKVDVLSIDSGVCPHVSGSDSDTDACGLKNWKS